MSQLAFTIGAPADEEHPTLHVHPIPHAHAAAVMVEHHYLHRKPSISFAVGLYEAGELIGAVTFGTPPSRHLQMSACPSDPSQVWELNRLWIDDRAPRNTESWFLSRALKLCPPKIIVSYADTAWGHHGYVYRASNFHYYGWTDMDRKTPRYDYIPWTGGHTREAFRSGYAKKVRRLPKVRYWTVTGSKTERRHLYAIAGWPRLSWKDSPPPGEEQRAELTA